MPVHCSFSLEWIQVQCLCLRWKASSRWIVLHFVAQVLASLAFGHSVPSVDLNHFNHNNLSPSIIFAIRWIMNSAAVIGRQLRQQQTNNRISGPVVPPTQYRGRGQSLAALRIEHSHQRDLLSPYTGADADKKFAKFSQLYQHEFYPHPAHRETGEKQGGHRKEKKKKTNRIKCTWHCFCVAFKALSSGVILLIIGTVMSIVGFFADSLSEVQVQHKNGTITTAVNKELKNHLLNLTYVGPVIMGLGGIVVVAACVLTFEVRDTLGVKAIPEEADQRKVSIPIIIKPEKSVKVVSQVSKSSLPVPVVDTGSAQPVTRLSNTNETATDDYKRNRLKSIPEANQVCNGSKVPLPPIGEKRRRVRANPVMPVMRPSPSSMLRNECVALTDFAYLPRIPSPQDIELSDPDGCSLNIPSHQSRWRARCSCSGSPTGSMIAALHNRSIPCSPRIPLPPSRLNRMYASVESDGLTESTESIDEFEMIQKRMTSTTTNHHTRVNSDRSNCLRNEGDAHFMNDNTNHHQYPLLKIANLPDRFQSISDH